MDLVLPVELYIYHVLDHAEPLVRDGRMLVRAGNYA
jgi:hypothetical protein